MWYLTRSTGIVATVLAVAALIWGLMFSARATGNRRRPNWWLDLHNWLGGAALAFTAIHVATAYFDRDIGLRVVDLLVPGVAAFDRWALAWGVIGMWTMIITVFSSWPKRRFSRRVWRVIHLTSVAGTALAILHAEQYGTDVGSFAAEAIAVLLVAGGMFALGMRVFGILERRSQ